MPTSTPPGSRTTLADVRAVLDLADAVGATLWLDGGWGVDALLGEQTRDHGDLDVAIEERHLDAFLEVMHRNGFHRLGEPGATAWNFLLGDDRGVVLDLHVIVLDAAGNGVLGPAERGAVYPAAALAGRGTVGGRAVRCIDADYAVRFHDAYPGDEKDRRDVRALCARFGLDVPAQYR